MEQVVIGRTGLQAKRLGFGGIPIQRVDEKQAVETVLHAIQTGIDFLDTARNYTTSERKVGRALRETDQKVILASKSLARTSDGVRKDLEISLKELQRDYIDLYQLHFVNDEKSYKQVVSQGGALEGLRRAKEEGIIGHIGITSHKLDLFDTILDDDLFESIMLCFSFLEPLARDKMIPKALKKNVGVLVMKAFSGGAIEDPKLALKYVFSQPGTVVLAGVESKDLVDVNWKIFQASDFSLTEREEKEIEGIRKQFEKVFCRRCDYCQPCPEGVPIQNILGARTLVKRMGAGLWKKGPRREIIEKARKCTGCAECTTRCPYQLPIPELVKENLDWIDEQFKSV